jgi:hypothetical protein
MVSINTMGRRPTLFLTASVAIHVGIGVGVLRVGAHSKDVHDVPKPALAGETFDIASVETAAETAGIATTAQPERVTTEPAEAARPIVPPGHRASRAGAPEVEVPLTYGAVGDRSASSIIVTLSRGFPQAASTDAVWQTVAFGDAGSATMEVELAEDGTVSRWSLGAGASPALRQGMVRTMSLVGGRTFIARGAVTKLHVEARVTTDAVRDGSDAVYAVHSEHEGDTASAYFSLAIGRRVDLVITTIK